MSVRGNAAGVETGVGPGADFGEVAGGTEMDGHGDVVHLVGHDGGENEDHVAFGEDQARYLVAVPDADALIAKAQAAGLHASVVGHAGGDAFASRGDKGELFSIPVAHLREWHEGWMPGWLEA